VIPWLLREEGSFASRRPSWRGTDIQFEKKRKREILGRGKRNKCSGRKGGHLLAGKGKTFIFKGAGDVSFAWKKKGSAKTVEKKEEKESVRTEVRRGGGRIPFSARGRKSVGLTRRVGEVLVGGRRIV